MTDRLKGFVVTLQENMREDDAQEVINAIKMIKNVLTVKPLVTGWEDGMFYDRVKRDLISKLWDVLK